MTTSSTPLGSCSEPSVVSISERENESDRQLPSQLHRSQTQTKEKEEHEQQEQPPQSNNNNNCKGHVSQQFDTSHHTVTDRMDHLTIIDLENDDNGDVAAIVVTSTSSSHTTPVTLTKEALGQHHQSLQLHLQTVRSKKRSDNKTSQGTTPALQANHYHHYYNDSDTISTPGARSDDSTSNCSSSVNNNNSNISFSEYTPRSSYSELSPSSRRKRSRQMRVNKTNEFTDSFMARPLWKDELTHETRQLLLRKRECS